MQFMVRQKYLDELIELYGTPDIKVITGIRRSGKSVLLQEFITYLQSLEEKSNIVMINLQELEFDHLLEYHALHKYVLEQYKEGMTNVLLIDEVQLCPQFELAINSIYTKGIYDIYITGSNAFLLSSDLATLFTGRTMEIKVYPFSFMEYLTYYEITDGYDDAFDQYVRTGGMPGAYVYKTEDRQYDYVRDVYSTILVRDFLELRRRGYEVYVGKLYKREVDFVAKKREAQIYIQVSDNISDEKTFEREHSPLLAIRDAYPKMIIARTHHETYDYQGVQVVDICRWLRE